MRFPEFNDEWEQTTLGKVLVFETGYPFSSDGFNEEGDGIRLVKNRDLKADDRCIFYSEDYDEQYIVQDGDVLIGMDGDFSPCLWKKGIALLNQRVGRIKVKGEVSSILLYHLLGKYLKEIELKTASTTVKHLSHKDVENIKAFLPVPDEQRKIAAFLSLLDERIEAQSETIKDRKTEKATLLRQLFDRSLRFPGFSEEWTETTLGGICQVLGGGTPRTDTAIYWGGDIQWFTPTEVGHKKFVSSSNRTITSNGLKNSGAKLLPKGTVLLTTRATIGECSIAAVECCTNQGFQSLVPIEGFSISEYLYQVLLTKKEELLRKANGSTFKEISTQGVKDIPINFPKLPEQTKIADFLSLLDERIETEEELLRQYESQKRYLLKQMFV